MVNSEAWKIFLRYADSRKKLWERPLRDPKRSIEQIRYTQGRLDGQEEWTDDFTPDFIRQVKKDLAEAAAAVRDAQEEE